MKAWITGNGLTFPHGNASTNRLTEIALGFESTGFKVKLIPFQKQKELSNTSTGEYNSISYEYFNQIIGKKLPLFLRFLSLSLVLWKVKKLSQIVKKEKVSIIFCGTSSFNTLLTLYLLAKRNKIKFIYDIVEDPFSTWMSRKLSELTFKHKLHYITNLMLLPAYYHIAWRLPDYVSCISGELKVKLIKLRFKAEKIYLFPIVKHIHTQSSTKVLKKASVSNKLIHSGSSYFSKDGLKELLAAIKLLKDQDLDIVLEFYGGMNKPNTNRMHRIIGELGIEDRVIIKGHVPLDNLFTAQKESLAQICFKPLNPQNRYNFATKIIDYLNAERPVILSNLPVYKDYFTDRHDAIIVKEFSSVELAKQIRFVYENQKIADDIGRNGKNTLISKLNASNHVMKMLNVFELNEASR